MSVLPNDAVAGSETPDLPSSELGTLSVLNCSAGDMKFSFNSADPLEAARAQRVVEDMLKRGYMLFVEVHQDDNPKKPKLLRRVQGFDPQTTEYILADGPGLPTEAVPTIEPAAPAETPAKPEKKGKGKKSRVSAKEAKAHGVAPIAGG